MNPTVSEDHRKLAERIAVMYHGPEAKAADEVAELLAQHDADLTEWVRAETRDEYAWLIERGGLCLGTCEYRFKWVTFTDENALRFSRQRDAYAFMETAKWENTWLHLEGAQITEHSWSALGNTARRASGE